jgi:fermentation-respiration switch protein FrsA (DUF1100 family)
MLGRILWKVAFVYGCVAGIIYVFQRRLQYMPDGSAVSAPGNGSPGAIEEVTLMSPDGLRLQAWYLAGTKPVTFYILHGNGGHRGYRLPWMQDLKDALGASIFIIDYRSYGGSEGTPTEEGLYMDAEAGARWLREKKGGKVVYVGESLGSAVAVELATRIPPDALIIQGGFASAVDVARDVYFFLPVNLLMKDRYDAARRIGKVACPMLFIHGDEDGIVPMRHGKALFEAAMRAERPGGASIEWYAVRGAGHNDVEETGGAEYHQRISEFLESCGIFP